jgi:hypothetical protein
MKVVVQNGANHCLSRAEAEAIVALLPKAWSSAASKVVLVAGETIEARYFPKEKTLSISCSSVPGDNRDKAKVTYELVGALARAAQDEASEELHTRCIGVLK